MTAAPLALADPPPATTARPDDGRLGAARRDPAVVIAGCLVFALVLFLPPVLNDGDTLWQISTGAWIIDHRAIPATDPFSFTAGDRHWSAHEWLAETLMALAYRAAGLPGIMVLAAAAAGLTAGVLLHHLRRFLPGVYAASALIIALCHTAPSMLARPHLLAWPCLALWCGGVVTARADRTAPSWALLPVMLLWVNLHGSFILGLLLAGALMIEALLDPEASHVGNFVGWTRFIAAALLVALCNPDRLAGVLFAIRLRGMQSLAWIGEWQPPDFAHFQPVELTVLGGLALGFSGRVKLPPIRLMLLLGLVYGALAHTRNQQILGIVGVLILAEPLGASLRQGSAMPLRGGSAMPLRGGSAIPLRGWGRLLSAGAVAVAAAALTVRLILPLGPERSGAPFAALLDAVPPALRGQPVLNEYRLGARLIFNGVRPFIDSRADLYGDAFLARYHRLAGGDRSELARTLAEYHIAWTIFTASHPVVGVMDEQPGWHRLIDANDIVIHALDDQAGCAGAEESPNVGHATSDPYHPDPDQRPGAARHQPASPCLGR